MGRHSLARLWPTEFKAFKNATCENLGISFSYDNVGTNKSSHVINANKINSSNVVKNNVKPSKSKITSKNSNSSVGKRGHVSNSAEVGFSPKFYPRKVLRPKVISLPK